LEGYGPTQIARILKNEGISVPTAYWLFQWAQTTVQCFLRLIFSTKINYKSIPLFDFLSFSKIYSEGITQDDLANGLYVSSIPGFLFVLLPLGIVYLTSNQLLWSLVYCSVLALANVVCLARISGNISRPQPMSGIQGSATNRREK